MKIIGISGTNGSGKDTVGEMLAERHGWLFISSSGDLIIPELKKRGLPLEREQMSALTAEWRRQAGKGAIVNKAVDKFNQENKDNNYIGLVLGSIRHPWEADRIHELGGKLVWIDADPIVRFRRINKRSQGDKDAKSFEQFLAEEKAEMQHSGDEATLSMAEVKKKADMTIENNGEDIEKFKDQAEKALAKYL